MIKNFSIEERLDVIVKQLLINTNNIEILKKYMVEVKSILKTVITHDDMDRIFTELKTIRQEQIMMYELYYNLEARVTKL